MSSVTSPDQTDAIARLREAFTTALELAPDADHEALAYRETPAWDSVAHMQLIVAIEGTFDVMLETEEVLALSSFPEARNILRKHGIAF
ncbi:MAG TPA: acyl carrier protein [Gemmatimonas sp.]|uniref:acyl carrier protein n=1 Tax=Gemmatimonas sp. TaxID=1962908 RepID=UPI002EDAAC63